MGRELAIGDVHGCFEAMTTLLKSVKPGKKDTVIFLGDYIDRGPASRKVVKYLLNWPWPAKLVCLQGNHEVLMEEALTSYASIVLWDRVGGSETLDSYDCELSEIPKKHRGFLFGGRPFYKTKNAIYVHGGLDPNRKLSEQNVEELMWRRFTEAEAHCSGKLVVCGHTVQREGIPADKGHTICIDTGVCRGKWLTCLDVKARRFWQANEKRKVRKGSLNDAELSGKKRAQLVAGL